MSPRPTPPRAHTLGCLGLLLSLCLALLPGTPLTAAMETVKERPLQPVSLREDPWLMPAGWAGHLPPTGAVNAPGTLPGLAPSQGLAIALVADEGKPDGSDREQALGVCSVSLKFEYGGRTWSAASLKPAAIRKLKASGADAVLAALGAAGIATDELGRMEQRTSMVTVAVFNADWTVPALAAEEELIVNVELREPGKPARQLKPAKLRLRPWADWLKDPVSDYEALAKRMNRHRSELSPGQLLPLLRECCKLAPISAPPNHGIFASAYRQQPAALEAALELYPTLDPRTQMALLYVLRCTGVNLRERLPSLPAELLSRLDAVPPMKEPEKLPRFEDPVSPKQVSSLGHEMDLCWAAWMSTGEAKYLRALVELLSGAPDFKAFEEWTARKGGAAGLNASVARGLYYQIAGWSIGSFQRTDPLVADWLAHWRKEPDFPRQLSEEIGSLHTNPAFQRKGK